jgi:hypothetical protein
MKISHYNLIIFISNSYDDHKKLENSDWQKWFKSIVRIFNNIVPEKILLMLKRKNNKEIDDLCKEQSQKNNIKIINYYEKLKNNNDKYEKYIEKRDNGNIKALEKNKIQKNDEKIMNRQIQERYNDLYVNEMLSVWKKDLDNIIRKRDEFIESIKIS